MMLLFLMNILMLFLPGGQIDKRDIGSYINRQLSGYEKVEFEVISAPHVEAGVRLNIDEERQLKLTGNIAYVPVKVTERNGQSSQSVLSVRVRLYRRVLVAANDLRYGTKLTAADFAEKLADVSQLRGSALTDISKLSGNKARLSIKAGDILTQEAMQPLPVIKSGERVLAIYAKGRVVITMEAVARQDGCTGDIIRIASSDNKLFKAKVIDENSVKIQE